MSGTWNRAKSAAIEPNAPEGPDSPNSPAPEGALPPRHPVAVAGKHEPFDNRDENEQVTRRPELTTQRADPAPGTRLWNPAPAPGSRRLGVPGAAPSLPPCVRSPRSRPTVPELTVSVRPFARLEEICIRAAPRRPLKTTTRPC
ncbi:hypothetical protein GCM10009863_37430 [Streptomyces axinellae]|uniref:Uncharacterized protein n=1 Tax=Streptomyces axinellae TaxID=552788 RepID=A0ABP6CP16_9ACTN